MSRDNDCNSGAVILSFLAGTVVGAAVALLTAPRSGRETRELLTDYGTELKARAETLPEELREYGETALDRGKEMIERGREMISRGSELAAQGKDFLDEKKRTLSEAIEAGKKAMEEEREVLAHKLGESD